jgi:hypothetical protein
MEHYVYTVGCGAQAIVLLNVAEDDLSRVSLKVGDIGGLAGQGTHLMSLL